ncbi:MAG: hypothetical protein KBT28_10825 [Bacteroidales bacterium]|nr:hypothetical protein [Candidatus Colimorpha merdihippi]
MKKIVILFAIIMATIAGNAQHTITLTDTVFVGSSTTTNIHETSEEVWSIPIIGDIQAYPLFKEEVYTVCSPFLPYGTYDIRCEINQSEWWVMDPVTTYIHDADSDGFGFIVNEHMPDEELYTAMLYRDSVTELKVRHTGEIKTVRFVSSSSMVTYFDLRIDSVDIHYDTVIVNRVAVNDAPSDDVNQTSDIFHLGQYAEFEVYNLSGMRLFEGTGEYVEFSYRNLPSGVYFIRNRNTGDSRKVVYVRS